MVDSWAAVSLAACPEGSAKDQDQDQDPCSPRGAVSTSSSQHRSAVLVEHPTSPSTPFTLSSDVFVQK
eukprot:13585236-Alexandrium_andersonii.AAC.1